MINIFRTIARTLNDGHHAKTYGGLSKADTTWPISAFITHLVYLKGTAVEVDLTQITVCPHILLPPDQAFKLPFTVFGCALYRSGRAHR